MMTLRTASKLLWRQDTHLAIYHHLYHQSLAGSIGSLILWEFSFLSVVLRPDSGSRPPLMSFEFTHVGHATFGRTPLDEWSDLLRNLCLTIHNIHKILNIYIPGAIRNHDPSKREAKGTRLRPHDHWDRPLGDIALGNNSVLTTVQWIKCLHVYLWSTG
jgi:hypothetical protein